MEKSAHAVKAGVEFIRENGEMAWADLNDEERARRALRSSRAIASAATFVLPAHIRTADRSFGGAPGLTDMVMSYMQIMNEKRAEADEKLAIAAFTEKWTLPAAPEIADPLDLLWVAES